MRRIKEEERADEERKRERERNETCGEKDEFSKRVLLSAAAVYITRSDSFIFMMTLARYNRFF